MNWLMVWVNENYINYGSIWIFIVMLFFVLKNINEENKINRFLDDFKAKNESIKKNNDEQLALLDYYQTTQYKDLFAKENQNLLNPWEKVIILVWSNTYKPNHRDNVDIKKVDIKTLEPYKQWLVYLNFDKI